MPKISATVTTLCLTIIGYIPVAEAAERFKFVRSRGLIPAEAGWERIIGGNGRPVIGHRNPEGEKRVKLQQLLSTIEKQTLEGHRSNQQENYSKAAGCFQKAAASFAILHQHSPPLAEIRLVDYAEILEAYAQTLLQLKKKAMATVHLRTAAAIRKRLSTKPSAVRTYVDGYASSIH